MILKDIAERNHLQPKYVRLSIHQGVCLFCIHIIHPANQGIQMLNFSLFFLHKNKDTSPKRQKIIFLRIFKSLTMLFSAVLRSSITTFQTRCSNIDHKYCHRCKSVSCSHIKSQKRKDICPKCDTKKIFSLAILTQDFHYAMVPQER